MGVGTALNLRTHAQIIATVSVVNPNVLVWPVENRDPQEIDQALAEMGRVLNIDTAMIQGMHYEGIHPVSEVVLP